MLKLHFYSELTDFCYLLSHYFYSKIEWLLIFEVSLRAV